MKFKQIASPHYYEKRIKIHRTGLVQRFKLPTSYLQPNKTLVFLG